MGSFAKQLLAVVLATCVSSQDCSHHCHNTQANCDFCRGQRGWSTPCEHGPRWCMDPALDERKPDEIPAAQINATADCRSNCHLTNENCQICGVSKGHMCKYHSMAYCEVFPSLVPHVPDSAAPNASSSPTPGVLCGGSSVVYPSEDWLWSRAAVPSPSCTSPAVQNVAEMCDGDPTSVVIRGNGQPQCLSAQMPDCKFSMRDIDRLDFDVNMINCGGTWAAPLWMSPDHWVDPGVSSGEIDMMENCPANAVWNNFAGGGNQVRVTIADPNSFQGHTTMWKQADGDGVMSIHVKTCDPSEVVDGSCPETGDVAYFRDIYSAHGCNGGNCMYTLISDIWNGLAGDDGYRGCAGGQTHASSGCHTSVANIRIKSAGVFTGKCAALSGAPTPSPSPSPAGLSELRNVGSGKCIDLDSTGNFQDGTKVQIWDCTGWDGQEFEFRGNEIVNPHSGKCLDIDSNGNFQDGTKVQLWDCTGWDGQKWEMNGREIKNTHSGKCLDVDTLGQFQDGSKVQIWNCAGTDNQMFDKSQASSLINTSIVV